MLSRQKKKKKEKLTPVHLAMFLAKDPDLFRSRASCHAPAIESDSHEANLTTDHKQPKTNFSELPC